MTIKNLILLIIWLAATANATAQTASEMVGTYFNVHCTTGDTIDVTTCNLFNDSTVLLHPFWGEFPFGGLKVSVLEDGELAVDQTFYPATNASLSFEGSGQYTPSTMIELNLHYVVWSNGQLQVDMWPCMRYVRLPVGIEEEVELVQFHVFPNPTQDFVSVFSSSNSKLEFQLFDASSRSVEIVYYNSHTIDLRSRDAGLYFLRVVDSYGRVAKTIKLIKL